MVTHHFKNGTTTKDIKGHVIHGNDYIYKLVKEITNETKNKEQDTLDNHNDNRNTCISVNSES